MLLWLTMNETIRNKEFSLFFIEKEALRGFFRSVISHVYAEESKLNLFTLPNTQVHNIMLFKQ